MRSTLLTLLLLLLGLVPLRAQRMGVGYYDLDGLYDTIPSRFYDDSPYTPSGRYAWSTERYDRKIANTAAVIDSMALTLVGLYGVENEAVVRDLVMCCQQDYSYIHRTRNSLDGQDFALLYFGDKLMIGSVEALRNMLIVEVQPLGEPSLEPFTIILARSGDDLRDYLELEQHDELVVVMGLLYQDEIDRVGYDSPLRAKERRGEGNYLSARGYIMHDRIAVNRAEKILKSGVYITPWLLSPDRMSPLPTYDRDSYVGGYSKYLPIFAYIF